MQGLLILLSILLKGDRLVESSVKVSQVCIFWVPNKTCSLKVSHSSGLSSSLKIGYGKRSCHRVCLLLTGTWPIHRWALKRSLLEGGLGLRMWLCFPEFSSQRLLRSWLVQNYPGWGRALSHRLGACST